MNLYSMTMTGGCLNGQTITFSPYMTNLIGIRGGGKSTLLETARYALDLPSGKAGRDGEYKQVLVQNLLGSGGKVSLRLVDGDVEYVVERIWGEAPVVFRDGLKVPNLRPEAIIKALYFGQKDLSEIGSEGFGQDLIQKFFGAQLQPLREEIAFVEERIGATIADIRTVEKKLAARGEWQAERADLKEKLRLYAEYRLDDKLRGQVEFRRASDDLDDIERRHARYFVDMVAKLKQYAVMYEADERKLAAVDREECRAALRALSDLRIGVDDMQGIVERVYPRIDALRDARGDMERAGDRLSEEFARLRREIRVESVNPDDFMRFQSRLDDIERKLADMQADAERLTELTHTLEDLLERLEKLRFQEFDAIKREVAALNDRKLSISILFGYRNDKQAFFQFLEAFMAGANIQKSHLRSIAEAYNSPIDLYADLSESDVDVSAQTEVVNILKGGAQLERFWQRVQSRLADFLTYQVPNTYTLLYKGRELRGHSIGQRASALIMFLLSKGDADVLLIDQPEDDLDNVTIYEDVVTELRAMRGKTQFLFATHNPNIPVLGECDQVIRCQYRDGSIELLAGSIDDRQIRNEIVAIMEGGRDAFNRRRSAYKTWGWPS